MRSAKRILTVLAMLLLCLTLMAVSAFAVSVVGKGTCGENMTWLLDGDGVLTISGKGTMQGANFASYGYGPEWFQHLTAIQTVRIEDGVTSICEDAFAGCTNLTSVTIPDSITSIGSNAFSDCAGLTNIDIPDGITSIESGTFSGCAGLTNITIPDGVSYIGDDAFSDCSGLTSIDIPDGITSIESGTFSGCTGLTNITIPDGVSCIGDHAFSDCSGLTSMDIPDGITSIGNGAFSGCTGLTSITIPESVSYIGGSAFSGCTSLNGITIPGCLSDLGGHAFSGCTGVISLIVSGTGDVSFNGCTGTVNMAISGDSIDNYFLWNTTVPMEVTILEGVTNIGYGAFKNCTGLTSISIPDSVTDIDGEAFDNCRALEEVHINNLEAWMRIDFGGNPLSGGNGRLYVNGSEVTELVIPDSITKIKHRVFQGCTSLTSVTIPGSVTSIDLDAFSDCTSLTSVVIQEGVTSIGTSFTGCTSLTSVTIPGSVSSIVFRTFSGCTGLTKITIPESVTEIFESAFSDCDSLTDVYYTSDEEAWNSIYFYSDNEALTEARIHYGGVCNPESVVTSVVTAPTCTQDGHTTYTCVCGLSYTDSASPALGHSYESVVTAPTYTSGGYTTHTCSACGDSYVDNYTDALLLLATPTISRLENTANGIKVTWGAVENAEAYRVFVKTSKGWATVGTTSGTSLTYSGAKSGSTYTFTVRCLSADGKSYISAYNSTGWKQTYVAQPTISKFENVANGVKITWDKVSGAGQYRVFVKTSKGWATVGTTTGNSLTYTGAKSGSTYTFTVRCLSADGKSYTSSYNTTGWKQTYVAQPTISKFENTASGIKVTWNAVAGAGKYRVYVKTSSGWATVGTTTGTSLTYTGAKSGYTYTFTVRALNSAGTAFVSSYNTTGWKQTYVAQPAISKLENTASGIKVTWGAVNGAAKYRVFVKTSSGWAAVGTTTGTSLTYTGAKSGYTYTFTVRALNSAGTAFVSSYNSTGWKQTYVAQPSITKLTNTTSGISITWGAVNGAAKYRVFVKTSSGWKAIGTTTGTSLTWTGAASGVTYTFTVRCLNSAGTAYTSAFSSTGWSIKRT